MRLTVAEWEKLKVDRKVNENKLYKQYYDHPLMVQYRVLLDKHMSAQELLGDLRNSLLLKIDEENSND